MSELFVPNKLRNKKIRDICIDFIYLRNYYQKSPQRFVDYSRPSSFQINIEYNLIIYISENYDIDIINDEDGVRSGLTFIQLIKEILKI